MSSESGADERESPPPAELGRYAAAALVFGASASVLVVEIVALRLLAPYLGLTLETSTLVIGIALAAIALGSWAGGRMADVIPPRRALGPLLGISGVAVAVTPFVVRGAATPGRVTVGPRRDAGHHRARHAARGRDTDGHQAPADQPGPDRHRGWASCPGIGTAGAIVGTVLTGFVLISRVPVSGIMFGLGVGWSPPQRRSRCGIRGWRTAAVPTVLVLLAGVGRSGGARRM